MLKELNGILPFLTKPGSKHKEGKEETARQNAAAGAQLRSEQLRFSEQLRLSGHSQPVQATGHCPASLKISMVVKIPKNQRFCFSDYCLTSPVTMKCFRRIVLKLIKDLIPAGVNSLQFAKGEPVQGGCCRTSPSHSHDSPAAA